MERLQRVLAARGVGSRRKAEDLIRSGRVRVDGEVVSELGVRVDPRAARIEVDGRPLRPQRLRYLLMNKPSGYITTASDERGRRTVLDLVDEPERVYPVGRLDRDTDGLLLLTNDGDVANRVMHPRYQLTKEYNVLTTGRPSDKVLERVRRGITVDGKRVVPEEFRILRETHNGVILTMTIHEGMNRVVRRMMEEAGIPIGRLRRVRIGPLSLAGIPVGAYRDLTPGEIGSLLEALRLQDTEAMVAARASARAAPTRPRRGRRWPPATKQDVSQSRDQRTKPAVPDEGRSVDGRGGPPADGSASNRPARKPAPKREPQRPDRAASSHDQRPPKTARDHAPRKRRQPNHDRP
jgi:23S rRNA pseudouridine2605 synthase